MAYSDPALEAKLGLRPAPTAPTTPTAPSGFRDTALEQKIASRIFPQPTPTPAPTPAPTPTFLGIPLVGKKTEEFIEAVKQTTPKQAAKDIAAGFLTDLKLGSDAVVWRTEAGKGPEVTRKFIGKKAQLTSDKLNAWVQALQPENPTLANAVFQGIGSTLPFYVLGFGVGTLAGGLATFSPFIASWFGASAAGAAESAIEAGGVYSENVKAGKSVSEASKAADRTFMANIGLNIILDKFGPLNEQIQGVVKKALISAPLESLQEVTQQVISNTNTGRPWSEGLEETALVAGIVGLLGGLVPGRRVAKVEEEVVTPPVTPPPPLPPPPGPPGPPAPPVPVKVAPREKPPTVPPTATTNQIYKTFQEKYGKSLEKGTVSEVEKHLETLDKPIPLDSKSEVILKKITSPARGIETATFERQPKLLYGGENKGIFTDAYILINDKAVAKKFQESLIETAEKKEVRKLMRTLPDITSKQAESMAKKTTQRGKKNALKEYLTAKAIKGVFPKTYSQKETKILGFGKNGFVYMTDGKIKTVVSGDKLALMRKLLPEAKIRLSGDTSPVVFAKEKKIVGLLMPLRSVDFPFEIARPPKVAPVKAPPPKPAPTRVPKPTKIAVKAKPYVEGFADIPSVIQPLAETKKLVPKTLPKAPKTAREPAPKVAIEGVRKIKALPLPEMVELANTLMGQYPIVTPKPGRKFGVRVLGMFIPEEGGKIKLNSDIFNTKRPKQAAKTLAHEVGHLDDYLPDHVVSRGNLLGRLASLKKFFRSSFTNLENETEVNRLIPIREEIRRERQALQGQPRRKAEDSALRKRLVEINKKIKKLREGGIKNKDIQAELWELSKTWRPFKEPVSDEFLAYRLSPNELYADATSILFNDPYQLQAKAPIFWKAFFENIDSKPKVKENLFALWDQLNGPSEILLEKRLARIYEGYAEGKKKRLEILGRKRPKPSAVADFVRQHVTRFDPIYRKMADVSKDFGIITSPKQLVRMQLEEMQLRRNESFLFTNSIKEEIDKPLTDLGLTEDDLGVLLQLERNLAGRKDIANPYGLQGKYSKQTLAYFEKALAKRGVTPEQFALLEQVARRFRSLVFEKAAEFSKVGGYSAEVFEKTILPNRDTYATYQVLDHLHANYIIPGIKQATGTLKPIENPAVSSILKTLAVIEATEVQKGKLAIIEQLEQNFPEDISEAKALRPKGVRVGWRREEGKVPLEYLKDGKLAAVNVDPYIAAMFDFYTPNEMHNLIKVSASFNRVFKPLVTTYNLSWGFFSNIIRDAKRTYKNLGAILPTVGTKQPLSLVEFIKTWLTSLPQGAKFQMQDFTPLLKEALKNKAFTTPFVSFDTQAGEAEWLKPIISRYAPKVDDVKATRLKSLFIGRVVEKVLEGIKFAGSTFETTSKIAGYQLSKKRLGGGREAGFITRNYVGTPNFMEGGAQVTTDNNIFVFSNMMIQAARNDAEIATNPETRSGYWYRTFLVDLLPKLLMIAGAAGLFGKWVKEIFDKATEYDKTNYTVVPIGIRDNGKAVYFRLPADETGRLFSSALWKLGTAMTGDLKKPEQTLSIGAGYIPSLTPIWEIGGAWLNLVQGRNPYDNYRGRLVVDETTWKAGGMPVFMKMVQWTFNKVGLSQFSTYSDESDTTFDYFLKLTPIINRAIKSTDYGLTEKEQAIKEVLDKRAARRILSEKKFLDKYIKLARKSPDKNEELKEKLVEEVFGPESAWKDEERERRNNLRKKFNIGILKGTVSREMDSLINAGTNAYKIELLKLYKKSLSGEKYRDLVNLASENRIISETVLDAIE